jgi:hypothetical protein
MSQEILAEQLKHLRKKAIAVKIHNGKYAMIQLPIVRNLEIKNLMSATSRGPDPPLDSCNSTLSLPKFPALY